jgi:formylglycine-generating enzyme required for sulfatase activity
MTRTTARRAAAAALLLPLVLAAGVSCARVGSTPADAELPIIKTKGGVEMVLIPAGSFEMGSRNSADGAEAVHPASVDAFLMDRTEVTQAEFARLELPNPSHFKAPDLPAEQVTWAQAARYCNARSEDEGLTPCYNARAECNFEADGYRLPTEAEWEYACRAGGTDDYAFGSDPGKLGGYAWFADNAAKKTHPVGQKKPNAWGLYDMHGNVAEWCNDVFDKGYYALSPLSNPRGPKEGKFYALRGGSWKSPADGLRSSARLGENPGFSDACLARDAIGFRCVRKPPAPAPATPK